MEPGGEAEEAVRKLQRLIEYAEEVKKLTEEGLPPPEEFFEMVDLVEQTAREINA